MIELRHMIPVATESTDDGVRVTLSGPVAGLTVELTLSRGEAQELASMLRVALQG